MKNSLSKISLEKRADKYRNDVIKNYMALSQVPEAVQMANPDISLAAVKTSYKTLQYVPEAVQIAHPGIPLAAVQQHWGALDHVSENVQLAQPHICLAAVKKYRLAAYCVINNLKTNVEALAKLYTTSEEQLRSDLLSLEINDDVINQVICSLKAQIATSSSMIEQLLGTSNDSKQPAEHPVESIDVIPATLLPMIQGYVYTPSNQENDEKESKDFSLL